MAKKPAPPPSPPASSSEEEESSSDEEQPPSTSKPEPQTPAKEKDDEDEEEESEDESEEESDDDDEEPGSDSKKPQPPVSAPAPAPAPSNPASESVSESESDDDSDSEAAKLVTPISSRPMADSPVLKASDSEKPNGKPLFQRIWTPDDEIAILNAMADFEPEHGSIKLNANTIGDFLGFVKDSLSIGVSGNQLVDKIRRLKKKYSVVAARAKNNGKELKFTTAHDRAVYELAKKVWGKEKEGDDGGKRVVNGMANGMVANAGGKRGYPLLKEAVANIVKNTGNSLVAETLETIDSEKASVLEKKLKKQKMAEIKHTMHKLDLLKETLKLIMEGAERAMD